MKFNHMTGTDNSYM